MKTEQQFVDRELRRCGGHNRAKVRALVNRKYSLRPSWNTLTYQSPSAVSDVGGLASGSALSFFSIFAVQRMTNMIIPNEACNKDTDFEPLFKKDTCAHEIADRLVARTKRARLRRASCLLSATMGKALKKLAQPGY